MSASSSDLKDLYKQAGEIAKVVPESMQEAAFNRALDMLTGAEGGDARISAQGPRRRKAPSSDSKPADSSADDVGASLGAIDRTAYPQIDVGMSVLNRSLWVLKIAKDEQGVDGLSAPQIADVLTGKFRVKTRRQNVTTALDKANRLVDRTKEGRGVRYRIMGEGDRHLAEKDSSGQSRAVSRHAGGKRRKTQTAKSQKTPAKANRNGADPGSKASGGRSPGRVGPKGMLTEMLGSGFFDKPRTIADIRLHLEQKHGRRFKPTDISPALVRLLREKKLDREKGDAGQYEYIAQ